LRHLHAFPTRRSSDLICAALPVLPLLMAAVLDRFAGQIAGAFEKVGGAPSWSETGRWVGSTFAVGVVAVAGVQNWQMYIGYYLRSEEHTSELQSQSNL